MPTALTLYSVTGHNTTTVLQLGKLTTSSATSSVTHVQVATGTRLSEWTTVRTGSTGHDTAVTEPAFNRSKYPSNWTVATLAGKQMVAGTWTRTVKLKTGSGSRSGCALYWRIGYRVGTAFTLVGTASITGITLSTTYSTLTLSVALTAFTIPATGQLAVQLILHLPTGTINGLTIAIGSTNDKIVTPGYQTPSHTGTASFLGSGVFAATSPSVVKYGTASFLGSGVFSILHPQAAFTGSGTFAAVGVAWPQSVTGMPGTKVELALTGTVWTGSNWVDITPFVKSFQTARGRQHELQRPEAGKCTLTLTNRDGRFNPWSKNSPYYNQLPATDSNPTSGAGTWAATNATLARVTSPVRYGSHAWSLTATASGSMSAVTDSTTSCVAGRTYTAVVWARAAATARKVRVSIVWKNATGTVLSTSTGGQRTDATSGYGTAPWTVTAVAPAGAVKKDVKVSVATAAATGVHYFACAGVFDVSYVFGTAAVAQGWCVGQQKPLWPSQPIKITATWHGVIYSVFTGVMQGWTPAYGTVKATIKVAAYDYMHLLANWPQAATIYPGIIAAESGLDLYWRLTTASGSTSALDSSGNGHTGTITTAPRVSFGHTTALGPTTTASSADINFTTTGPHSGKIAAALAPPSSFSIELLVYPSATIATGDSVFVILAGWASGVNLRLVGNHSGWRLAVYKGNTSTLSSTTPSSTLTNNTWAHVVVTHASTGATKVYINKNLALSGTVSTTTGSSFQVGGTASGTSVGGLMLIEEVSVVASVLSTTTITEHYTAYHTGSASMYSGQLIKVMLTSANVPTSALETITTGTVVVTPPSVSRGQTQILPNLQSIEMTETGFLCCLETGKIRYYPRSYVRTLPAAACTVANDTTPDHFPPLHSPIPICDDTTLFNTIGISTSGSVTAYFASTPDSVARYGARILTGYTQTYFKTPSTAIALGDLLVTKFATPLTRVKDVQLSSVTDHGRCLPQMLGRKLLDAVEVIWQPYDGTDSPFTQTAQLEHISHTVTKTRWDTTWVLAIPV